MRDEKEPSVTQDTVPNTLWWFAVVAVAAWLLWMTLRSQGQASADLAYITTPAAASGISIRFLIDILGNVIVFVPLGAAAAFALTGKPLKRRLLASIAIGAALSATIELTQFSIPSRVSAWDDWLLNTLGTFIGAVIASILIDKCRANC